jgi:hypothetical protein
MNWILSRTTGGPSTIGLRSWQKIVWACDTEQESILSCRPSNEQSYTWFRATVGFITIFKINLRAAFFQWSLLFHKRWGLSFKAVASFATYTQHTQKRQFLVPVENLIYVNYIQITVPLSWYTPSLHWNMYNFTPYAEVLCQCSKFLQQSCATT